MFAGIVQVTGRVVRRLRRGDRTLLSVACAQWRGRPRPGDSVAVDGVCLTVTRVSGDRFEMDLGAETLARTTLGECRPGQVVNLEAPLRASDPIGGHLVQGHVDGTGRVAALRPEPGGRRVVLEIPETFHACVVERGAVAVNGVSLTVTAVKDGGIEMFLIPYTLRETNLGGLRRGDRVNLEFDPLGKYVARWFGACPSIGPGRVASAVGPDARKRDEVDAGHLRGAWTPETAPRRRNPPGAPGLRPDSASLVVDDLSGRLPPRSLAAARKPRARGPGQYPDRLPEAAGRTPPARGPARPGASGAGGGRRAAIRGSRNP